MRTYSELSELKTKEERYNYLACNSRVGLESFGHERYLNQKFYTSKEWRDIRSHVIYRDRGLDMGLDGFEISGRIYIHHMNPMRVEDIVHGNEDILEPEFLISTTHRTHNAIHYGDESHLIQPLVERRPGDTKLW